MASSIVEGHPEHARHRVARDVVLGRTEPAGADDQIDRVERRRQHLGQLVDGIADHDLQANVVADGVQPLRDDERVRVDAKWRQHFAADGNDPGLHELVRSIRWHPSTRLP